MFIRVRRFFYDFLFKISSSIAEGKGILKQFFFRRWIFLFYLDFKVFCYLFRISQLFFTTWQFIRFDIWVQRSNDMSHDFIWKTFSRHIFWFWACIPRFWRRPSDRWIYTSGCLQTPSLAKLFNNLINISKIIFL